MLNGLNTAAYGKHKQPSFGFQVNNALLTGFDYLTKNPAVEAASIDLVTMVAPRTVIDCKQNLDYGKETAFREVTAMAINPFMPGLLGSAMMAAKGFNGLYTNSETLNALHTAWEKAEGGKQDVIKVKNYVKTVLGSAEGLVGKKDYVKLVDKLEEKQISEFFDEIVEVILNGEKNTKKAVAEAAEKFTQATGAAEIINVKIGKGFTTNIDNLLRDTVAAGQKIFTKTAPGELQGVVNKLSDFSKKKSAWALAATIVTGIALQPINTAITRWRTGCSDFAGYKDFGKAKTKKENKNSSGFFMKKALAAAGIGVMMIGTMGGFGKKGFFRAGGLKNFMNTIELRDKFAHLNVIRVIYGSVLTGRFMSSRDETELKSNVARDYPGFLNWLVLGPVVAKGVAQIAQKINSKLSLLNGKAEGSNILKRAVSWITDVSLKSPGEVIAMKNKAKSLKAVYNGSRIAGLGYSMFMLGIGVPLLINKYIINKSKVSCDPNKKSFLNFMSNKQSPLLTTFSEKNKDMYNNFISNF